jgi:aspartyl-tRNA(Asn)/glutamyl-tRNA(Gln) amidotransferase subunit A
MTKTVEDCAIAYRVMAGLDAEWESKEDDDLPLKGLRIGMPIAYFWQVLDPEVERTASRAVALAKELGAEVREVVLPEMDALMDAARVILSAEAASELGRYGANLQDFGNDVRLLLEKGREVTAKAYLDAQRTRQRLKRQLASAWSNVDCLITPTTPTTAFRIDQTEMMFGGQMQDVRAVTTRLTRPFNALGWPALSLPCGFTDAKMPVGLQLVGAMGDEEMLFRVGSALEEVGVS